MADGDSTLSPQDNPQALAWQLAQGMAPQVPAPQDIPQSQNAPMPPPPDVGQDQTQAPPPSMQGTPQPQQQQVPKMGGMPLIANYLMNVIRGPQGGQGPNGQPIQPVSRGDMTLNFLSQFLGNMAAGMQQSGHGPGANIRGAGAAMMAPYQRSLQEYQLGQQQQAQQAQIQGEQARTQLAQAQTEQMRNVVQTPYGPMSQALASKVFPAAIGAEAKLGAAQTQAGAKIGAAQIAQGMGIPVDETVANLAGIPEMAGQPVGKGTWENIKKSLDAKGYKLADLGTEGNWIIDRAGNRIHKVSAQGTSFARGLGYALGRAEYTPFETVIPGTNVPTTISNLKALQTGAAKVPISAQSKIGGQYALYNDAYGILDKIDSLAGKVNLDDKATAARVAAGYAAIKDPASNGVVGETLSNLLIHQPINNELSPDERELVLTMGQGKAAGTGLRSIMGQAGSNEMQQRLDSALFPGGQAVGSRQSLKQQIQATRALLNRFSVGQPQVGLNAPGSSTALQNRVPQPSQGGGDKVKNLMKKYGGAPSGNQP